VTGPTGWRRRQRRVHLQLLLLCAWLGCHSQSGCERTEERQELVAHARFGVFYGGQVQQRQEIAFVLDRSKQKHGIRIDFVRPLPEPVRVSWELNMPGSSRRVRDRAGRVGRGRVVKLQQAVVPAGRTRFDQLLPFEPGDPLGTWNIRVLVEDRVVIDRPFLVFSEAARQRALRQDAGH
jgi:hypothetical protein